MSAAPGRPTSGVTHEKFVGSVTITGDVPCEAADRTYRIDTPWACESLSRFVTLP